MRQILCKPCPVPRFKQTYEGLPVPAVQDEVARFLYLHHHGGTSQCACTPTNSLTHHLQDSALLCRQMTLFCLIQPQRILRKLGEVAAHVQRCLQACSSWCGMRG